MAFKELNLYMKEIFINLGNFKQLISLECAVDSNKMMYSVASFILVARFSNHKNPVSMA